MIPAVPVPFGSSNEIARDAQREYIAWMSRQAVGGVAVWAHTGRGLRLSDDQRSEVLADWCSGLGDLPVICGVGVTASDSLPSDPLKRTDAAVERTVQLARSAAAGGASGVLVHPPTALRDLPDHLERTVELHRAVASVGLPVIAFYLYEDAGGISYSSDTVAAILDIQGVIGIKVATLDSVMTFQDVAALMANNSDRLLITGEDRFLGYTFTLGAKAALVGIAAACTDIVVALVRSWFDRDYEKFFTKAAVVDRFARATFVSPIEGYVQRMLWSLEADGVLPEGLKDPFGPPPPLDPADRERVFSAVHQIRSG